MNPTIDMLLLENNLNIEEAIHEGGSLPHNGFTFIMT